MRKAREIIGSLTTLAPILKVAAADMSYTRVVTIALKQRIAIAKKAWPRQAVIFQNDAFFFVTEEPIDCRRNCFLAT
jgi:hypothetical protein